VQSVPHAPQTPSSIESEVSFSLEEVQNIKANVTHGASYAYRISFAFIVRLAQCGEDRSVLHEIDVLERIAPNSSTKEATQFKRPPLHPFWHKHFTTPRHLIRNVGERWGLGKNGNRDLAIMLEKVADTCGDQLERWPNRLVHELIISGLNDRLAAKRMTGDWIIFAKHEGLNYYLDLATHQEATRASDQLLAKLRNGSAREFPFLFQ
jgi:hypothetical protein